MKRKYKILLIPVPPPYAGPEVIAKNILDSATIRAEKNILHINSNIRKKNSEKGQFDFKGVVVFIKKTLQVIAKALISKSLFMYLSSSKVGFIRDSIYIFYLR